MSRAIADLEEKIERPLYLICGMLKNKDAVGFLSAFRGLAVYAVASLVCLASAWPSLGRPWAPASNPGSLIRARTLQFGRRFSIRRRSSKPDLSGRPRPYSMLL